MSSEEIIIRARQLIKEQDAKSAVGVLTELDSIETNVAGLEALAEAYIDLSGRDDNGNDDDNVSRAYELYVRAAELDPQGTQGTGADKFLWLGQLSGGHDAIKWFRVGCDVLRRQLASAGDDDNNNNNNNNNYESKKKEGQSKLCDVLNASVEVWMTDLCMEPEAEARCEALVTEALMVDSAHADSYATLASVRLSQSRPSEARVAVQTAWDLASSALSSSTSAEEAVGRIGSLHKLARLALEVDRADVSEQASRAAIGLDDQVAESWYLLGLSLRELGRAADAADAGASGLEVVADDSPDVRDALQELVLLDQGGNENDEPGQELDDDADLEEWIDED
ncbi:hypothetical protein V1514DRAFT_353676 [Lipomyces japonicus]|uniref:uncharacterized protein n=1 Tax=Lipomyces japonicus TaxID=56871 RepID=UPI0034CE34B6